MVTFPAQRAAAFAASKLPAVPLEARSGRSFLQLFLQTFLAGTPGLKNAFSTSPASQPGWSPSHDPGCTMPHFGGSFHVKGSREKQEMQRILLLMLIATIGF